MATDSKGQKIKNDQILSIYVDWKKRTEAIVRTIEGKLTLSKFNDDGEISHQYCLLDEVLEKAFKVVVLKKELKKKEGK